MWRSALRNAPDEDISDQVIPNEDGDRHTTLWVLPWERVQHPTPSSALKGDHILLLHSLLLHNGLSTDLLQKILPLSRTAVIQAIGTLKDGELIAHTGDTWQITPLAYPQTRRYLSEMGYLTDDF